MPDLRAKDRQDEEIIINETLLPSTLYEGDTGKILYFCCLPLELPHKAYITIEDILCHTLRIKHRHSK